MQSPAFVMHNKHIADTMPQTAYDLVKWEKDMAKKTVFAEEATDDGADQN